jgi:hypothetical protein
MSDVMMFSAPTIAALVALWGFWALLAVGYLVGELGVRAAGVFLTLWLIGFIGSRFVLQGQLFSPYVAILDIALVFAVFHGDVRLT